MYDLSTFTISPTKYLEIVLTCANNDQCRPCAQTDIDYIDEETNTFIRFGYEFMSNFCYFFSESGRARKLVNNELFLDKETMGDPGREWNVKGPRRGKPEFDKYNFAGNSHKHVWPFRDAWFYNDKDGNIIFEITPQYPWDDRRFIVENNLGSYEEFMANYKPLVQVVIPKERMLQWIEQAKEIKKTL